MHRFFCTVCKKVKRVRALPYTDKSGRDKLNIRYRPTKVVDGKVVEHGESAPAPKDRIGVCRVHVLKQQGLSRAKIDSRVKVHTTIAKVKTPKAAPQQKGRK